MDRQNITLSLSKELLKKARHLAVEQGRSLSGLLADYLEEIATRDPVAERARARLKQRLRSGFRLGTKGAARWTRESLHER